MQYETAIPDTNRTDITTFVTVTSGEGLDVTGYNGLSCPYNLTFICYKDRAFLAKFEVLIVMMPNILVL